MKTGITGGIGSGKSYICKLLASKGIEVYDCDAAAKRLMRSSDTIRMQLTKLIGVDAYHADGMPNKAFIAQYLLQSEEHAHAIDAIVHPAVEQDFLQSGYEWMESAILYESGVNRLVDQVIVVTAPEEVRIARIMSRDHISREKAEAWIARQWPQEEIRQRAQFEIVNDGTTPLDSQIEKILRTIN